LPNQFFLLILANTSQKTLSAGLYLANLRGMIRALIMKKKGEAAPFSPTRFMADLSHLIAAERFEEPFHVTLLLLSPQTSELAYLSCGNHSLFHLSQGSRSVRELVAKNPPLNSQEKQDFSIMADNWKIGDLLVLTSFSPQESEKTPLFQNILSSATFSPARQAEEILHAALQFNEDLSPSSQVVMAIRRIG